MSDFEEKVLKTLGELQQDVGSLKQDVGDSRGLKNEFDNLKQSLNRIEVILESHEEKFDQIIEIVSPEMQKSNEQKARLDNHEDRILKLEAA